MLNDGKVVDDGKFDDILVRNMELIVASTSTEENKAVPSSEEKISDPKINKTETQVKGANEILQDNSYELLRQTGTWDVYKYYMQRAGPYVSVGFFCVLAIQAFSAQYASEFS